MPSTIFRPLAATLVTIAVGFPLAAPARAGLHKAYAGPGVFGAWVQVGAHAGPMSYRIDAEPVGDTVLIGEVRYHAEDGNPRTVRFYKSITVRTCNCYATVQVRFKGVPTGSAVEVRVNP